jgi:hypothetical protein
MHQTKKLSNRITKKNKFTCLRVAILAEEPLGWKSGKHYFPIILNGYSWTKENITYKIETTFLFDKDILKGTLTTSSFDVLLIPGGGVGDGEAIVKGFSLSPKVRKWKKHIVSFLKAGGGIIGICGGAALITGLSTGKERKPQTFIERQYHKSSLKISCVTSYYNHLAIPLLYPLQMNHPEKVGAAGYIFSFAPGKTKDGTLFYAAGVPLDFHLNKDSPLFADYLPKAERMRWWGGPALLIPTNPKRTVKVLARYPSLALSENENTKIYSWRYTGGITGLISAMLKAFKVAKTNNTSLKQVLLYTFFLAGNWKKSEKCIDLDFSNKPCITAEIYPNENQGRIVLCSVHPEYMIWYGGYIEEVDQNHTNCLASGLHRWRDISSFKHRGVEELTHTWWIIRRFVAWSAKVPDTDLPPIEQPTTTSAVTSLLVSIRANGDLLTNMYNI